MDETNLIKAEIRGMVKGAQDSARSLFAGMALPSKAETQGQQELAAKHGTPVQFAKACTAAVGEISVAQAHASVLAYLDVWRAA